MHNKFEKDWDRFQNKHDEELAKNYQEEEGMKTAKSEILVDYMDVDGTMHHGVKIDKYREYISDVILT